MKNKLLPFVILLIIGLIGGAIGGGYLVLNLNNPNFGINRDSNKNNKEIKETNPKTGDSTKGVGNIVAGNNAKIEIHINPEDPKFKNDKLPGYFPSKGFETPPPELSKFEGVGYLTRDSLLLGSASFLSQNDKTVILGNIYKPIFSLEGSSREIRRTAFELNGQQQAVLLQFGLEDLSAGTINLTYRVSISADGQKVWSGEVIYGTNQQLLSVPLKTSRVKTLLLEYSITQGDRYMNLFFTRAELIYGNY
jgi:hypothetical protein